MEIRLDKQKFILGFERSFGINLNARSEAGLAFILDKFNQEDRLKNIYQFAYVLATFFHESSWAPTKSYFVPIKEGKARSTSEVWIKYQSKYWNKGYYGRGFVQTTHEDNYRNAGILTGLGSEYFIQNPDEMLKPEFSYETAIISMIRGLYRKNKKTGRRQSLDVYLGDDSPDYIGARNIINGDVKKNGGKIANEAIKFERLLRSSMVSEKASTLFEEPEQIETDADQNIDVQINAPEPTETDQGTQAAGVIVNNAPATDSTVPAGFTPEDKIQVAPAPTGVKETLKTWVKGIFATAGGGGVLAILKEWYQTGNVDFGALLAALGGFIGANFLIIAVLLGVIALCYFVYEIISMREKQKSFRMELEFKARPDRNNVTIVPA